MFHPDSPRGMEADLHVRAPFERLEFEKSPFLSLCSFSPGVRRPPGPRGTPATLTPSDPAARGRRRRRSGRKGSERGARGRGGETPRGGAGARGRGVRAAAAASPACGTCRCLRPSWSRRRQQPNANIVAIPKLGVEETRPSVRQLRAVGKRRRRGDRPGRAEETHTPPAPTARRPSRPRGTRVFPPGRRRRSTAASRGGRADGRARGAATARGL